MESEQRREPEEDAQRVRRGGPLRCVVGVKSWPASGGIGSPLNMTTSSEMNETRRERFARRAALDGRATLSAVSSPIRVMGTPCACADETQTPAAPPRHGEEQLVVVAAGEGGRERIRSWRSNQRSAPGWIGTSDPSTICAGTAGLRRSAGRRPPARRSDPCRPMPRACGRAARQSGRGAPARR